MITHFDNQIGHSQSKFHLKIYIFNDTHEIKPHVIRAPIVSFQILTNLALVAAHFINYITYSLSDLDTTF